MPTFECRNCRKRITYSQRDEATYYPFCSDRCQMVDLGAWFDERYRIAAPLDSETDIDAQDEPIDPSTLE